jgi:hypothetical protein
MTRDDQLPASWEAPGDPGALTAGERTVFVLLTFASLVPIWAFRFFPGQDTPNHLYSIEVARSIASGTAPAALRSAFVLQLGLKSNVLFQAVMLGLCRLGLSIPLAHRLILSAYALAFPLAALFCLRAANPRARPLALLFVPLVWNWFVLQGLYNYAFSLVPALVWLGIVARDGGRPRGSSQVALAACALIVYLGHAGTFLVMALVSAIRVALPGDRAPVPLRQRLADASPLVLALLPAALVAAVGVGRVVGRVHGLTEATVSAWEAYGLLHALGTFVSEFAIRTRVADLLFLGPPLALLVALPLQAAWRRRPLDDVALAPLRPRRWPMQAALVLVVLYLALPHIVLGSDACARVRPFIVFCLVCYEGIALSPRLRQGLMAVALVCGLGGVGLLSASFATLNRQLADFTAGIADVPAGSRVYPMVFDQRGPSVLIRPFLHAWGYYGIERDIVTPFAFAWHETRFPYRYRQLPLHGLDSEFPSDSEEEPYALEKGWLCDSRRHFAPSLDCATIRAETEARLARLGTSYDFVLVWAAPSEFVDLLGRSGYRLVRHQGRMDLFRSPAVPAR